MPFENVFDEAEVAELNRVTDMFVERSRSVAASDKVFDVAPNHSPSRPAVRRIKNPTRLDEVYERARRNERLLDIIECLIGPGVRFDHSKLNFKPVGGGAAIDWHQDWAFYPHTNDDLLAVGVYLGDCGMEKRAAHGNPEEPQGPCLRPPSRRGLRRQLPGAGARRAARISGLAPGQGRFDHDPSCAHAARFGREPASPRAAPAAAVLHGHRCFGLWPGTHASTSTISTGGSSGERRPFNPGKIPLPVRAPIPKVAGAGSIFDDQAPVAGRSFASVVNVG